MDGILDSIKYEAFKSVSKIRYYLHIPHSLFHSQWKNPPPDQPTRASMIWPPQTCPTSSLTLCSSFPIASQRGPSGLQRPIFFSTTGSLHLLFPLPGMLVPESSHRRGRVTSSEVSWLPGCIQDSLLYSPGTLWVSIPEWITLLKYFMYAYAYLIFMQESWKWEPHLFCS